VCVCLCLCLSYDNDRQVPPSWTIDGQGDTGYIYDLATMWDQYKCLLPLIVSVWPVGTKNGCRFLRRFMLTVTILPRQARDKHRESTQKRERQGVCFVGYDGQARRAGSLRPGAKVWRVSYRLYDG
jgi:hypothetical protein